MINKKSRYSLSPSQTHTLSLSHSTCPYTYLHRYSDLTACYEDLLAINTRRERELIDTHTLALNTTASPTLTPTTTPIMTPTLTPTTTPSAAPTPVLTLSPTHTPTSPPTPLPSLPPSLTPFLSMSLSLTFFQMCPEIA